ncbi:hypothetical protein AB0368_33130 [Actinoplanes sp. NPDC051475]|uniref:hypothetical protein n=1 Tax=Actinoplanes sp. NPDC051475 TaxID=3157225 RepID=UPI00344FAEB8
MAIFRGVEVWPDGGFADRPWPSEPDEDAFVRAARGVCEVYSQALPPLQLEGKNSLLWLFCHREHTAHVGVAPPRPEDPVSAAVAMSTYDSGHVRVPARFAALPAARQRIWALDSAHEACCQLARIRGWNPGALDAARQHALACHLRYVWEGPWKAAPDRRHKARGVAGRRRTAWAGPGSKPRAVPVPLWRHERGVGLVRRHVPQGLCKTVKWESSAQATMDPCSTKADTARAGHG